MNRYEQLSLFEAPLSEFEILWREIEELKQSHNKTRKRLFKEIKELQIKVIFQSSQRILLIDELKNRDMKIA